MNKKLKLNIKLIGLTLIELIVTLSIVAIIAWLNIKNLRSQGNAKSLVDNATDIIVAQLNQANAKSNYSSTVGSGAAIQDTAEVCHISSGSGGDKASCNDRQVSWGNVNGIKFNEKVTVTIVHTASNKKYTVVYKNGSIDPNLTSGVSSAAAVFVITIKARFKDKSCNSETDTFARNSVYIWHNGVIDVERQCDNI